MPRPVFRSATWSIPIISAATILWGILFTLSSEHRLTESPSYNVTLSAAPSWMWGVSMSLLGVLVLLVMRPWAVALLASGWTFYAVSLIAGVLRYDDAAFSQPVLPLTVVILLVWTAGQLGVRHGGSAPPKTEE